MNCTPVLVRSSSGCGGAEQATANSPRASASDTTSLDVVRGTTVAILAITLRVGGEASGVLGDRLPLEREGAEDRGEEPARVRGRIGRDPFRSAGRYDLPAGFASLGS